MKLMFIGADHEVTGSCHYLGGRQTYPGGLWHGAGSQCV